MWMNTIIIRYILYKDTIILTGKVIIFYIIVIWFARIVFQFRLTWD